MERTERSQLTIRTAPQVHSRLSEAALRRGLSLNSFILSAAAKEADAVLEQDRVLNLSEQDAAAILKLLDNPPAPNAALTRAFARREELFGAKR